MRGATVRFMRKKVFQTYDRINTFSTLVKICTPGSETMLVIDETSLNQSHLSVFLSHEKANWSRLNEYHSKASDVWWLLTKVESRDLKSSQEQYLEFWSSGMLNCVAGNLIHPKVSKKRKLFIFKGWQIKDDHFMTSQPVSKVSCPSDTSEYIKITRYT